MKTLRDEKGAIPPNALLSAKAQVDALRTEGIAGGLDSTKWTELGPGNIGGRTRAIALHPTVAGTLFIGSVGGTPGNPLVMYASTGEGFGNQDAGGWN